MKRLLVILLLIVPSFAWAGDDTFSITVHNWGQVKQEITTVYPNPGPDTDNIYCEKFIKKNGVKNFLQQIDSQYIQQMNTVMITTTTNSLQLISPTQMSAD